MPKKERLLLFATAAAVIVLRLVALFRYRFDSDEQQHLHVAWGWTAGLVQYRDLFDNHLPLFHMLTAPLLALLGERSDILIWMRVPLLLTFAAVLWCTWALGRHLYDARIAAWGVLLLALFPPFFLKSLEYRPDNLWAALWMVALVGLVRGWRPFLIGLVLGAALAVSIKTILLVGALLLTGAITLRFRGIGVPGDLRRRLLEAAAGFALIPLALAAYFAAVGAWDELVYCNFVFNGRLATMREELWIGRATFPLTFGAVLYAAWRFRRAADAWRYFLALIVGVFTVIVAGFWVLISPRDFLGMMPIAAIFLAATLSRYENAARAFAIAIAVLLASLFHYADRFENRTDWHTTMLDQALRLSHPGEMLIDVKGETIFRRRPFYYALEIVARAQLARGIIEDTIARDVVCTRTYVAQADGPMWPPQGRAFLSQNFLNMGRLRAAGQWIGDDGSFTIAIPGEYVILTEAGEARGTLDGTAYTGARALAAGPHRFAGPRGAAVLWAPAFRRGHSPYHLRDLEF